MSDSRYIAVSLLAGLTAFLGNRLVRQLRDPVLVVDAGGLAVFAVSGALKALAFGLDPLSAVLLGTLTGIGGGMLRDVLVAETPTVLHAELYAVAAIGGQVLGLPSLPVAVVGGGVCFSLRVIALRRGWALPVAPAIERGG